MVIKVIIPIETVTSETNNTQFQFYVFDREFYWISLSLIIAFYRSQRAESLRYRQAENISKKMKR